MTSAAVDAKIATLDIEFAFDDGFNYRGAYSMKLRLILSCTGMFLMCHALMAAGAPAAAPAPAPHAAAAPAPSHAAAPASGGGRATPVAPLGNRGVASGGATRGMAGVKSGSGGGVAYRSPVVNAGARGGTQNSQGFRNNPNMFNCMDGGGNNYQSASPCPFGDGAPVPAGQSVVAGDTYNFNLFVFNVPGGQREGAAESQQSGGLGGFAEATAGGRGGSAKAGRAAGASAPGTGVRLVDPFLHQTGLPIDTQANGYPVMTNVSQNPSQYAIVLRSGLALATQEPPTRSGNMIVGHDRTGHLFSVRSSEVDLNASRIVPPPAPAAAAPRPKQ